MRETLSPVSPYELKHYFDFVSTFNRRTTNLKFRDDFITSNNQSMMMYVTLIIHNFVQHTGTKSEF